jgi:hypothetical protein
MHFKLLDFHSLLHIHSQWEKKQKKNNAYIWFFFVFLIIGFYTLLLYTAVYEDDVDKLKIEILVLTKERDEFQKSNELFIFDFLFVFYSIIFSISI